MPGDPLDEEALAFLPLERVAPLLARGKISPVELVEIAARRMERLNPAINAFLALSLESARRQARHAEREIRAGRRRGPLHGVPISLKDNIWTRGIPTTAGSKILAGFLPPADATVVRRLHRAGAIVVGKTNLHEFAYGVTTENPHYGPVRNPWDTRRMVGGSTGGSAAALAAGIGWGAVGSDTGGSVRIPPSLCGVVGLKPTFGRVSCYGVVPLSPSLDHVGPLAATVTGAAWLLEAIAGRDPLDPSTRGAPALPAGSDRPPSARLGRVRIRLPRDHFFENIDPEVRAAVEAAARQLERLGAKIRPISLPGVGPSVADAAEIAFAEARHYHESAGYFPARARDYGEDVRSLLERGGEIRAHAYLADVEHMRAARAGWDRAIDGCDALLAPATPIPAPLLGQKSVKIGGREETVRAALLRLCRPANFTGAPALVLPCGFTRTGLPIGLQLIGPLWSERQLLRIGYAYEQATDWHQRHPSFS
jgi:aspartyl-tRNA(Asn)/glutamyl-tRNA(Gln) amidotransferase subunit A